MNTQEQVLNILFGIWHAIMPYVIVGSLAFLFFLIFMTFVPQSTLMFPKLYVKTPGEKRRYLGRIMYRKLNDEKQTVYVAVINTKRSLFPSSVFLRRYLIPQERLTVNHVPWLQIKYFVQSHAVHMLDDGVYSFSDESPEAIKADPEPLRTKIIDTLEYAKDQVTHAVSASPYTSTQDYLMNTLAIGEADIRIEDIDEQEDEDEDDTPD